MSNLIVMSIAFVMVAVISDRSVLRLRQFVSKRNILDIPNERSSHSVPTPRGGGALIVTLVLCGLVVYLAAIDRTGLGGVIAYIIGGGLIATISPRQHAPCE